MPPKTMDEYIDGFPPQVQDILQEMRKVICSAAPEAQEKISYGIPTFFLEGNLVHFAGYKKHIGFYPAPSGIAAFSEALSAYESAKGSVKFPLEEPMPYDLIREIVAFRVKENLAKAAENGKK